MDTDFFDNLNGPGSRLARRRFVALAEDYGVPEIEVDRDKMKAALVQVSGALGYRVSFNQIYGNGYSGGRVTAAMFIQFCQFAACNGVYLDYRDLIRFMPVRRISRRSRLFRYLPESETVSP